MRRTKRFASFALAACMGVSLLVNVPAGTVSAAEPDKVVSGEMAATETDAEALDEAQEVVYDESEADADGFVWDGTTIVKYVGKGGDVKIPEKCTSIGNGAFKDCKTLLSIEIPSSVKTVGETPFDGCNSLKSVKLQEGITCIQWGMFSECSALTNIELPSTLKTIEGAAFARCKSLKEIKLPAGLEEIQSYAFEYTGLTIINIPSQVKDIDESAYYNCDIESIVVDANNKTYNSAGNCNAIIDTKTGTLVLGCKNTKIPENVTSIGSFAFSGCSELTSIKIPKGVTCIGAYAFSGCTRLSEVKIPTSVTTIESSAFQDCKSLTSIVIPPSVTKIDFFDKDKYEMAIPGCFAFSGSGLKEIRGCVGSCAEKYANYHNFYYTFVAIDPEDIYDDEETVNITTSYRTHVQSIGWQNPVTNGVMSGTSGKAKRLEGIEISVSGNKNLGIQYSTHCQTYGWLPWSANGEMNGTTGEAKRLEAIKIQLTGADKDKYDVYYRVHAQSYGWLGWAKNGEPSGTAGYAKRLEGIQIVVVKKDGKNTSKAPGFDYAGISASKGKHDNRAYIAKTNGTITIPGSTDSTNIMYKTHVQSFGWQNWVLNGDMSGTSGKAKRLEGINIKLSNAAYAGGIQYRTHVQTYGWEKEWKKDGAMSGTSGEAKRLEAIQIRLYGEMANHFDVYYRVHAQSYGWLGWAKNGEESGTAGYAKRLEGIQIVLVPKGGTAPANNYKNIQSVNTKAYIKK